MALYYFPSSLRNALNHKTSPAQHTRFIELRRYIQIPLARYLHATVIEEYAVEVHPGSHSRRDKVTEIDGGKVFAHVPSVIAPDKSIPLLKRRQ